MDCKYSYKTDSVDNNLAAMRNLTFTQSNSMRGIFFYRMVALVNMCSSFLLILLFLYGLNGVVELWWDRVLSFILSVVVYAWGFSSRVDTKHYVQVVKCLIYLQITHLALVAGWNDFMTFYFISLAMVQQAHVYCMRTRREIYFYLGYTQIITLVSIMAISHISPEQSVLYIFYSIALAVLQLIAGLVKDRFMRDMKMSQRLLKNLISKVDMAVFLTDDTGLIIDANTRATELFGYERVEFIGKDFKLLRKYYLSESEILNAYNELDKNNFWNAVTILLTKDGREIDVKVSVAPIISGDQRLLTYRVIDITDTKDFEKRLIEAKERAEEAVKVKGQFLAMMSHEIRTPLNGVIATASILSRTEMNNEQVEYVETIKKSGGSLLMLINDILDFSKMESGKMELSPVSDNPVNVVYDIADLLRPYAEEKGIRLKVDVNLDNSENLLLDTPRLKQVLLNLLGNALKFTEHGSVSLKVELIGQLPESVNLRYTVSDTGIGIPEEKMHLLFQSFSQVDSSTSRKYGGTGLGLAISQQIVQLMGGTISVKSVVNEGTVFSFTLNHPFAIETKSSPSKHQIEVESYDFSGYHALVVDDNEINRQVFKFMLDGMNFKVDMATNGLDAIEKCTYNKYDIVFMDMQMPEMDGIEATTRIRMLKVIQPCIVSVTANSGQDDKKRCLDAGMNHFLPKPFELSELTLVLQDILSDDLCNKKCAGY